MTVLTCPQCNWKGRGVKPKGSIKCPRCSATFGVNQEGAYQERQLMLTGSKKYHYYGHTYLNGRLFTVGSPKRYQDLVATGLFKEIPPSCTEVIIYKGARLQKTFKTTAGNFTFKKGEALRVEPDISRILISLGGGEIVKIGNRELLETLKNKKSFTALFIRDMGLGDIFYFNSCLVEFKRQFPQAKVTAATRQDYMFVLKDAVDEVIDLMTPYDARNFDISANLCRKSEEQPFASTIHRADIYANHMGFQMEEYNTKFEIPEEIKEKAYELLIENGWDGKKDLIGIQIYGSSRHRTWFPENSLDLSTKLKEAGDEIVFIHQEYEKRWDKKGINLTGKLDLLTMCGILFHCKIVIGPDSSGYHIKESIGNGHAIAIFSTINPDLRVRHYKNTTAIWEGYERPMTCGGPCYDKGCVPLHCMRYWSTQKVFDKIIEAKEKLRSIN